MNPIVVRLSILIAIFAAVFLTVEFAVRFLRSRQNRSRAINRRLRMIESGMNRGLVASHLRKSQTGILAGWTGPVGRIARSAERLVIASGVAMPAQQIIMIMLFASGTVTLITIFAAAFAGYQITLGLVQLAIIFGFSLGTGIPLLVLTRIAAHRKKRVQEQFPVALDIFVRGLKSGHPISAALDLLTKEMEDPIGSEFGLVVDEVSYGADLRDALQSMADRWGIEDIQMFVVSLSVQSETGGNLAEILTNLAGVIRARTSMYLKVRALSSEGRMTAIILTSLPIVSFVILFIVNPGFYLQVSQDPIFIFGFTGLITMYAIGFYAIRRMVDLKV